MHPVLKKANLAELRKELKANEKRKKSYRTIEGAKFYYDLHKLHLNLKANTILSPREKGEILGQKIGQKVTSRFLRGPSGSAILDPIDDYYTLKKIEGYSTKEAIKKTIPEGAFLLGRNKIGRESANIIVRRISPINKKIVEKLIPEKFKYGRKIGGLVADFTVANATYKATSHGVNTGRKLAEKLYRENRNAGRSGNKKVWIGFRQGSRQGVRHASAVKKFQSQRQNKYTLQLNQS
ncbi:MAG: hypothetical protein AABY07_00300 [Nanoarchaeota archaeon]